MSPIRLRATDAGKRSLSAKTLLVLDKLLSPQIAAGLSHGTRVHSVIQIMNPER